MLIHLKRNKQFLHLYSYYRNYQANIKSILNIDLSLFLSPLYFYSLNYTKCSIFAFIFLYSNKKKLLRIFNMISFRNRHSTLFYNGFLKKSVIKVTIALLSLSLSLSLSFSLSLFLFFLSLLFSLFLSLSLSLCFFLSLFLPLSLPPLSAPVTRF